jgi:hypothetical protein
MVKHQDGSNTASEACVGTAKKPIPFGSWIIMLPQLWATENSSQQLMAPQEHALCFPVIEHWVSYL